jgi:hypothetical protein
MCQLRQTYWQVRLNQNSAHLLRNSSHAVIGLCLAQCVDYIMYMEAKDGVSGLFKLYGARAEK